VNRGMQIEAPRREKRLQESLGVSRCLPWSRSLRGMPRLYTRRISTVRVGTLSAAAVES
jgi:hypothetical protein